MRLTPPTQERRPETREIRYEVSERGDIDCYMDDFLIYWIVAEKVMEEDWEEHMSEKVWVNPEQFGRVITEARSNYKTWKQVKQ